VTEQRDPYGELISGVLIAQIELVRLLEASGALERGAYRAALEAHLERVSPKHRDERLYVPIRQLIRKLPKAKPARKPH
jgi:hypothetical protein